MDLCQEYYGDSGISYLGFPLWDTPTCNILPFVGCAADFIEEAISGGGKCLVNCQMGVSRSASCAMSYLMIKQVSMLCFFIYFLNTRLLYNYIDDSECR